MTVTDVLHRAFADRAAVLFTGAGFSTGARDLEGQPLPLGRTMAAELRAMCFGACDDDSTLQDLCDVAAERHAGALRAYLERRLRVGDHPLPDAYGLWFAAPWEKVYTLNVDDLEVAAARQFVLPRELEVIHLNGMIGDDLEAMTFSTLQHAMRLVEPSSRYLALIDDLASKPFVFVGTALDEQLFWQHLQLRRDRTAGRPRPRSFLVTPRLSRARRELLEGLAIEWIPATADEFAARALAPLVAPPPRQR